MGQIWLYSLISVVIVSLISLLGVFTLAIKEAYLKKILTYFVSFSAGAIFGDVFIHLLPEIVKENNFTLQISIFFLTGVVISFLIEKIICWNHDHFGNLNPKIKRFAYMILFGDSVHNFIDGLAIGSSFLAGIPVGIATTIAVILHEIPHEVGDFGSLIHGGFTKKEALIYNFISALTAVLGTVIALILYRYIKEANAFLLPFAAANLIYIAGSNLIPELHKEVDIAKGVIQTITFILGIMVMLTLLLVG